jgi:hypothetical protein
MVPTEAEALADLLTKVPLNCFGPCSCIDLGCEGGKDANGEDGADIAERLGQPTCLASVHPSKAMR